MSEGLAKKLRLSIGQRITVQNRPDKNYFSEFDVSESIPRWPEDIIILFVKTLDELKKETMKIVENDLLKEGGRLLIAYPKKGNPMFDTYVRRDDIFPALGVQEDGYIPNSSYKFNQMVKLDHIYTIVGIKHEKKGKTKKTVSQSVSDYISYLPEMEQKMSGEKEALAFFRSLTPGYQRNWARYVYSAKRPETQEKRMKEMIGLLKKGIKSKNL